MGTIAAHFPTRSGRPALAGLLLALALPGCQPLDRMDALDRVFDPRGYAERHAPPAPAQASALPPIAGAAPTPLHAGRPAAEIRAMEPIPNPQPEPERLARTAALRTAPRPDEAPPPAPVGEDRLRLIVQQHHWLTRFWSELTAAQQRQVERQFQRAGTSATVAAGSWDVMGLTDRARLVFGGGSAPGGRAPLERSDGAAWAASP